eukprot:scaffold51640_cov68-Phaeocystis_antarctica.AAC.1
MPPPPPPALLASRASSRPPDSERPESAAAPVPPSVRAWNAAERRAATRGGTHGRDGWARLPL